MSNKSDFFDKLELSRIDQYRHIPKIDFGVGAVENLGEIARDVAQNKKAIIVTDENIAGVGLTERPKSSLEEEGFTVDIYKSAPAEPTPEESREIIKAIKSNDYGLVVGLGGGSSIDKSKLGAVIAEQEGDLDDYLYPGEGTLTGSKPKIMIPTTSGTGSEVSGFAVCMGSHETMGEIKTWIAGPIVQADAAVVDPSLVIGCPPGPTAASGMDALSHTAEAVLSLQANPVSDALSLKAVELVSKNLQKVYNQGEDLEARWNMALAAMIGGTVIDYEWVAGPATIGHCASEGISARYGISHGEACGTLLPYVYWYNLPHPYARKKVSLIAEAMGQNVTGLSEKAAAEKAITATFDLLESVGLSTSLDIPKEDIDEVAEYILKRGREMYALPDYNPRRLSLDNLKDFFLTVSEGREAIDL